MSENLLAETRAALMRSGKAPADVVWCGSSDGDLAMPWSDFEHVANIEYDQIEDDTKDRPAVDLVVCGVDWWLSRNGSAYDGAEWWQFNTKPSRADEPRLFTQVLCDCETLEEANQ